MFTVYILQNNSGKLYIGQSINLEKRLIEHNDTGKGYTSKYRPWKLLWYKRVLTRVDAMKEGGYLKSGLGRDWIKKNILRA